MCKVVVHGFIFLVLLGVSITHILTPQNDWTPISKVEVLRTLSRLNRRNADNSLSKNSGINLTSNVIKLATPNNYNEVNNDNSFKNDAIKLVQPINTIKLDQQSAFYPVALDTITSVNDLQSPLEQKSEQVELQIKVATTSKEFLKLEKSNNNEEDTKNTNFRKPKAIAVSRFNHNINNDKVFSTESLELHQETTEGNRKMYQVTEDSMDALKEEQSNTEERTGYYYAPPKINHENSKENNLTNILLDILSKHNIQPGDVLPNYSLSRRQRNQRPLNGYMLIPIPLRAFPQFNNFNLDPLAVLLSNYGYYLPGSYGIRGKYRNLYGYLASNNIHNNKPFGSYKIFSDTDSSN